jgi:hypothetical protein
MSPQDIHVFQALAGLFTLTFVVLCYFILRMAARFERDLAPVLADLRAGAADFRVTSELAREGAETLSTLVDSLGRLGSLTKLGANGIWSLLARAAGALFSPAAGTRHEG